MGGGAERKDREGDGCRKSDSTNAREKKVAGTAWDENVPVII